ncbi:alphaalpha-2-HS-glycoproteinprotein [Podarcis lilfordi]|uniref:Alphaalpha-2-HS-glycoproteinprotein n=1 Tax=Podarcis lilfordi TaxID=74358 RepID=A0AA35P5P8_9SAUR|nr:alphaalpha-2-HS-glycoproteinprotein [Podarcis lilfordi]
MRSLVAPALLGLILGCIANAAVLPTLPQGEFPACDDVETEHMADFAVNYINAKNNHGYKYALNRIEKVKVLPRRPFGKIAFLELDLLETECHVSNPLPAENCTIRPQTQHAVEGDCDVKLLIVDGAYKVLSSKCHSTPDSVEDIISVCPDCNPLSQLDDPKLKEAANSGLAKFNAENVNGTHYQLLELSRGFTSHMPLGTHVEFAIAATNCSRQQAQDPAEHCHVATDEHAHNGFCKASIIQLPPVPVLGGEPIPPAEEITLDCALYDHQAGGSHFIEHSLHHLGKNIPSPGTGRRVLDLIHSHNDTHASHESHSAEAPAVAAAKPVVKRAVEAVPLPAISLQLCPGRIRHFKI